MQHQECILGLSLSLEVYMAPNPASIAGTRYRPWMTLDTCVRYACLYALTTSSLPGPREYQFIRDGLVIFGVFVACPYFLACLRLVVRGK